MFYIGLCVEALKIDPVGNLAQNEPTKLKKLADTLPSSHLSVESE